MGRESLRRTVTREPLRNPPPILSVLICTLPNRIDQLSKLVPEIRRQSTGKPVEYFYLGDNKSMSVGEKRNALLSLAAGEYVIFIDDDDNISEDFINEIISACQTGADCITYKMAYQETGKPQQTIYFGMENGKNHRADGLMKWLPNHCCAIKKSIAQKEKFEHINLSEDHKWAEAIRMHLKTEYKIDKVLYYYNYDPKKSETHPR